MGEAYHTRTACSARTPAHAVCPLSVVSFARTGDTISYHTKPTPNRPARYISRAGGRKGHAETNTEIVPGLLHVETVPRAEAGIQPTPGRGMISTCRPNHMLRDALNSIPDLADIFIVRIRLLPDSN